MSENDDLSQCASQKRKGRGIYILPNLVTTVAMFCGFYAILSAMHDKFSTAAALIFVAMIFDGLDGRIARLTGTASDFGVQFDSLSDLVSFGVAPALVIYQWSIYLLAAEPLVPTRFGWMTAFIYAVCAALRLARFNTQVDIVDKACFVGLPSPASAGVVAGFVWVGSTFDWSPRALTFVSTALLLLCGFAMVSNIKYFSGKSLKIEGRIPFSYAVIPAIILALVFLNPATALFGLFVLYALHGPIWKIWRIYKKRQLKV